MAGQFTPTEGVLSGQYVIVACDFMRQRGFTAEQILAGTQINLEDLQQHPDHLLSYRALLQLIENISYLDSSPTLSFEIGLCLNVSHHGFLGYAVQASPTLGDALLLAARYTEIRAALLSFKVDVDAGEASISIDDNGMLGQWLPQIIEALLGCLFVVGNELLGSLDNQHLRLELPFPIRDHLQIAMQMQGATVTFDCPKTRICFPSAWLNKRFQRPDPNLVRLAVAHCDEVLESVGQQQDWVAKVGQQMKSYLADPKAQEKVATALNMTPRTLHRRLASNQLNFKTMIDNLRRNQAIEQLRYSSEAIGNIAQGLGYSDQSNFVRAFKRWTGKTPKQFRDQ